MESTSAITIVPANEATWEDLDAVFGTRGYQFTPPGQEITRGELHVGSRILADAGFAEVSRPTLRRVVMRIDL